MKTRRQLVTKILLVVMMVGLIVPWRNAEAITLAKTVSLTATDFAAGKFALTGLAQDVVSGSVTQGGVQMVPQGALASWRDSPNSLCRPTTEMGTASFKNFLYVVGGTTASGGSISNLAEICRTKVLDRAAATDLWTSIPSENLPDVRTALMAVAVPLPSNPTRGVLYALGGRTSDSNNSFNNTIYSAGINPDGSLLPWVTQATTLPDPMGSAAVTAYTTPNGKTFIYLVGGYKQGGVLSFISREVLRAEVDTNGTLGQWQPMPNIPIPAGALPGVTNCEAGVGLYNHDAINFDAVTLGGDYRAFMVLGGTLELGSGDATGCPTPSASSPLVFLGKLDPNGNLTWETESYNLPQALSQTRAIAVNQKIYVVGGLTTEGSGNNATNKIFTTNISIDSFTLPPSPNTFKVSDTALDPQEGRAGHGLEVVTIDDRPLGFMFGGQLGSGVYQDSVFFGNIGTADDVDFSTGGYASPALYLSPPIELRATGIISQVLWTSSVATTVPSTDIQMQYKLAASQDALRTTNVWQTLDGDLTSDRFSVQGENAAIGATTEGSWFQYRALLTTSSPQDETATPILRNVRIQYRVLGHPSLYVVSASIPNVVPNALVAPAMIVRNDTPPGSANTENVLDADIEDNGSFFVDLYAYPPGTEVITPTRNPANGAYSLTSVAFAQVGKPLLQKDIEYAIPADNWRKNCGLTTNCPAPNWQVIFNQPGDWTVLAIVDSQNNVNEADDLSGEWENDNIFRFTVSSQISGETLYMPIIFQQPAIAP